jgi:hypothetical protein
MSDTARSPQNTYHPPGTNVEFYPPPEQGKPEVSREFVEKWMNTWDSDCGSFGPSIEQVITLLREVGVEVEE